MAENAIMIEAGNGHGCEVIYEISSTVIPDSSNTSRATHCSKVSPGSRKPAKLENLFSGQIGLCPSRRRSSLSFTKTITAESVRG